jgi:hypothetical protein
MVAAGREKLQGSPLAGGGLGDDDDLAEDDHAFFNQDDSEL